MDDLAKTLVAQSLTHLFNSLCGLGIEPRVILDAARDYVDAETAALAARQQKPNVAGAGRA
jgi:hypothetical protein